MKKVKFGRGAALIALLTSLMVAGCSDRMIMTSFQDITSESQRMGCPLDPDFQYSGISLTGFIAAPAPGFLYSYNPRRGPMTAIGVTGGETSYIVTKTIHPSANNNVMAIKKVMEDIKLLSLRAVQLRLDEAQQDLQKMKIQTNKDFQARLEKLIEPLQSAIEKDEATQITVLNEQISALNEQDAAFSEQREQDKEAATKELEKLREELEKQIEALDAKVAGKLEELEKDEDKPAEGQPAATDTTPAEEQEKDDIKSLPKTYAEVELQLAAKEKALAALVSAPGILIFRWAADNTSETSGTLAGIAGGGGENSEKVGGYAIVSGLRMSTLYLGSDIHTLWPNVHDIGIIRTWPQVITMVAQAQSIAYVSENSFARLLEMQAELDAERLGEIAANWQTMLKLSLAASMARVGQMSNTGYIGDMDITVHKLRELYSSTMTAPSTQPSAKASAPQSTAQQSELTFMQPVRNSTLQKVVRAEIQRQSQNPASEGEKDASDAITPYAFDGWTTFYQVSTNLDTLRKMILPKGQPSAKEQK